MCLRHVTAQKIMSHAECVYAAFSSNCAKDLESCGMCLRHVTAQKIMSHVECVYAAFSSNYAKKISSHVECVYVTSLLEFAGVDSPCSNLFPCRVEAFGRVFAQITAQ